MPFSFNCSRGEKMRYQLGLIVVSLLTAAASPVAAQEIPIDKAKMMQLVMQATNKYRASKGVKPVLIKTTLSKVAILYVNFLGQQSDREGHNADGSDPATRIAKYYKACKTGENYAAVTNWPNIMPLEAAADRVVKNWIASPGHEKNMVDPGFKYFGFGVVAWQYGDKKTYKFIQVFADDCGAMEPPPGPVSSSGRPILSSGKPRVRTH